MRVLKFGGSSVASAECLISVGNILVKKFETDDSLFVVVSAFGGVTDSLIKITNLASENDAAYLEHLQLLIARIIDVAKTLLPAPAYHDIEVDLEDNHKKLRNVLSGIALIQEASHKTRDYILSFGERNSAYVLSQYLLSRSIPSEYLDARDYIITDDNFGSAAVNFEETYNRISEINIQKKSIRVITGFIGSDAKSGRTTTLGRGGSDYSAAIFAAGLNAEQLEIWTDVNGVLTSDPRSVKRAFTIPEMTYAEALEMSHFGAKVLYAPTIRPVRSKGVPTVIKNTFNPDHSGTTIHSGKKKANGVITGLSAIHDISIISLEGPGLQGVAGISARLFKSLATGGINIIMITQASSEQSISIAVDGSEATLATTLIEKEFEYEMSRNLVDPINISTNMSLLAIVGENMRRIPGVSGKLFQTLGKNGINVEAISQGSSELNITFAIKTSDVSRAMNSIHDDFFLSEYKTIHLFIVGVGLIGSKLLEQLQLNLEPLKKLLGLEIVVNAISNSKKMIISEDGIDIGSSSGALISSDRIANVGALIKEMIALNFAHSIFIDNTASIEMPKHYTSILDHNIAISTPNKIAMSSGLDFYKMLKKRATARNTPLRYETNVAAGLPVISTIENLINSGDRINKIQAVLSGSVSFIFNSFNSSGNSFSDIVKEAQAKGFTEPDPREDLSGADVKRKLLILARESGYDIEDSDITINQILSHDCMTASDVESFFAALESDDLVYKQKISSVEKLNKRLRFIAQFENGKGLISLQEVGTESPFYSLSGSDNMIVFHTNRYNATPLVIRGPGAGADVTAAGVLAEIINISSLI